MLIIDAIAGLAVVTASGMLTGGIAVLVTGPWLGAAFAATHDDLAGIASPPAPATRRPEEPDRIGGRPFLDPETAGSGSR